MAAPLLAIETSCDETAAAVIGSEGRPLSSVVASQAGLHAQWGGVVPEAASRSHLESLPTLARVALGQAGVEAQALGCVAATSGPGLAPALLVGLSFAKGLAVARGLPFVAVNHIEGHLFSPFIGRAHIPPHVSLIVSGGHTLLVAVKSGEDIRLLGRTRDDAAGEAFDKAAKLLGLPYPGGAVLDELAEEGDAAAFDFPRALRHSGDWDFSFSGLKTSLRYLLEKQPIRSEQQLRDVCASFREAVVEVLVGKLVAAVKATGARHAALSGGVACNRRLRGLFFEAGREHGFEAHAVEPRYATDNAAMIGFVASWRFRQARFSDWDADIRPALDWQVAHSVPRLDEPPCKGS